jgi:hypothetical protein
MQLISEPFLITGGVAGEIVIWKVRRNELDPYIVMYPNLAEASGSLLAMCIVKVPLLQLIVSEKKIKRLNSLRIKWTSA